MSFTSMDTSENNFIASYDQHADAIFRFCYLKTRNNELAKDLTQETFMKVWSYVKKGNEITHMKALLYRIAGNLVIDWYRKKKTESLEDLIEGGFEPRDTSFDALGKSELSWALGMLDKLGEDEKNLIIWRYVDGLSPKEIARTLGNLKENVVSVRIHRALKKLKKLLHGADEGRRAVS